MLDPEAIEVDPDLLLFNAAKAKVATAAAALAVLSEAAVARPMLPCGPVRRIVVDATWGAAPYQKIRRVCREPGRP